jgi:hypothetical protein
VQETTGATSQGYTYNPDGTPNALNATNTDWYYLSDPQGSVTDVTTSTGDRAASYDYTPYGQQRGPLLPDATTVPTNQPMRYTGQHLDLTSGLYNLRARQYDPPPHGSPAPTRLAEPGTPRPGTASTPTPTTARCATIVRDVYGRLVTMHPGRPGSG